MISRHAVTRGLVAAVALSAVTLTTSCGAPQLVGSIIAESADPGSRQDAESLMGAAAEHAMAADSVSVHIDVDHGEQWRQAFADMELPKDPEQPRNMAFRVDDATLGLYDTIVYGKDAYAKGGVGYWENGGLDGADAQAAGYVDEWVLLKDQGFHFDGLFDVRDVLRAVGLENAETVSQQQWSGMVETETIDGQDYYKISTIDGYQARVWASEPTRLYTLQVPAQAVDASLTGVATLTFTDWNSIVPITPPAESEVVVPLGADR